MVTMQCPDCQEDLIQIPTSHGPGLDVCSSGHGLWLDVGEVNFFVEDYTSLKRALGDTGGVAVKTETLCPRCGTHMESETVSHTSFLSCDSCRGWWLPQGSLTRLNETYRGAAVPIQIDETELYHTSCSRDIMHATTAFAITWFQNSTLPRTRPMVLGIVFRTRPRARRDYFRRGDRQSYENHSMESATGSNPLLFGGGHRRRIRALRLRMVVAPTKALDRKYSDLDYSFTGSGIGRDQWAGPARGQASSPRPSAGFPVCSIPYAVEERVGSGKHARWETIAKGTSEQPFFVSDTTGRVLVVPLGAELILPDERTYRNDWLGELPPTTIAGLNRLGISTERWMGSKNSVP